MLSTLTLTWQQLTLLSALTLLLTLLPGLTLLSGFTLLLSLLPTLTLLLTLLSALPLLLPLHHGGGKGTLHEAVLLGRHAHAVRTDDTGGSEPRLTHQTALAQEPRPAEAGTGLKNLNHLPVGRQR